MCVRVCTSVYMSCDESGYVFFFYAVRVPSLWLMYITIKLHKFSTISRWIDNDNLHAKNVWQMPPVPPVVVPAPPRRFVSRTNPSFVPSINRTHLIARVSFHSVRASHLPKYSFSLQPMSVINMQTQEGIKTLLCNMRYN